MLGSTITGVVTFAGGLAILWYGLSLIGRSFVLSVVVLVSGCATASLGALSVTMLQVFSPEDALRYMVLPAAVFLGACLFKYGPQSRSDTTRRRIVRSAVLALVMVIFAITTRFPIAGLVAVLPLLAFWLSLIKYRPASRWAMRLRRTAYSALVAYAILMYLSLHSGLACTKRGCFWYVSLPFVYTLQLPHPYDYYIAYQLKGYLVLVSLVLTIVCSIACLGLWAFDTLKLRAV